MEPPPTTLNTCPIKYSGDPEEALLCQLAAELEMLQDPSQVDTYHQYHQYFVFQVTLTTLGPPTPITCLYEDNPTSSTELCNLWCSIQSNSGASCLKCPIEYTQDPANTTLCNLWTELQILQHKHNQQPTTELPKSNVTCVYKEHSTSATPLCDLWCQTVEYSGKICTTCPYQDDPEAVKACNLWEELVELQGSEHPTSDGLDNTTLPLAKNVTCLHSDNPTSAALLCELWCDVQGYSHVNCITCPHINDPEAATACDLWEELVMLQNSEDTGNTIPGEINSGNTIMVTPGKNVTCVFSENPTSSSLLCNLWCGVQDYNGSKCVMCPYLNDPEAVKACGLWEELVLLQNTDTPNSDNSGLEDTSSGTSTSEIPSPKRNETCIYSDNQSSATLLCELWCDVKEYSGIKCVTCPYINDPEAIEACKLWEELLVLQNSEDIADSSLGDTSLGATNPPEKNVLCPYSDNPTSAGLLCELWCGVGKFSSKICVTCPYINDPESVKACQLWEELVVLQNSDLSISENSSAISGGSEPGDMNPKKNVTCSFSENPTSADLLCELWCGVKSYSDIACVSCPYINDQEAVEACKLWEELLVLQNSDELDGGSGSLDTLITNVSCIHIDNPTSSLLLCDLWCGIQSYSGVNCMTCPYTNDPEAEKACELWEELLVLQGIADSSMDDTSTGEESSGDTSSGETTAKKNVTCSYSANPTSSTLLCELWCDVQKFSDVLCVTCPYMDDLEAEKACELWEELIILQNTHIGNPTSDNTISGIPSIEDQGSGDPSSGDPSLEDQGSEGTSSGESIPKKNVTCVHRNNTSSAALLCELWCGVQEYSGVNCVSCPYISDPEAVQACELWEELLMLENTNLSTSDGQNSEHTSEGGQSSGDPNAEDSSSGDPNTEDLSQGEPKKNVTCSHIKNPTSSELLCELWCDVKEYSGLTCVICPYIKDPEAVKACELWEELLMLQNPETPISGDPSSGDPSSGDLSSGDPSSGDPSSGDPSSGDSSLGDPNSEDIVIKKNVTCSYSDNPTSAALLCDLWCGIQELNGINCVTCPYNDIQEAVKACELWEELVMNESLEETSPASTNTEDQDTVDPNTGNTTTATAQLVSCPYTDSPESGPLLCKLFCEVQAHIGSQCCPDQYVGDPEEQKLCSLWQELQELGGQVTSTPAPLKPVQCLHMDNPTSSEALCELWCAVQEHSGDMCLVCPEEYVEDPASEQLCSLWSEAEILEHSQESGVSPAPPPGSDVTCPYRSVSVQN